MKPDYLFEVSWEICNKVGGIHTVISTKAISLAGDLKDNYILIGPDVWKETSGNPDFIEDPYIYRAWREKANQEGLNIRAGRWNVAGQPVVVLVDFTPYFTEKDKIFFEFWEKYKLDSLSGQWDYIEPAMFGYAAARVIESFYDFNVSAQDRLVAQFHEWMTGTGVLYLKSHVPQAATVFTTHATVMGRTIAGNGMPLYPDLEKFDVRELSRELNVASKHSLEKTAAGEADAFTTVSEITGKECKAFLERDCDVITVNGFEDSFVPAEEAYEGKRKTARETLRGVMHGLLNQEVPEDSLMVINSGRYEYKNKGIDLYIDALGKLNRSADLKKDIIGVIAVPAHQSGMRLNLRERLNNPDFSNPVSGEYLTHHLYDEANDPILNRIRENGLNNSPDDRVKIIFIPAYLNGQDGMFDLEYYDFLAGFDLSVFPSYYEPWGYTPMESAAFRIPTVTATYAGFGLWVQSQARKDQQGVYILDRDKPDEASVETIAGIIRSFASGSKEFTDRARRDAYEISRMTLWSEFIRFYYEAYAVALEKSLSREHLFTGKLQQYPYFDFKETQKEGPSWKKLEVKAEIPEKLEGLHDLSRNLWWSWNCEATELFEKIDPEKWEAFQHNPIVLLESLPYERWRELEQDEEFVSQFGRVYDHFVSYCEKTPANDEGQIAYFSMEFGLHESLKLYSGGLGVLAGDYLKQASDSNKDMVGVGLLYRYGYFQQKLSAFGEQISEYERQSFFTLPLHPVKDEQGQWVTLSMALPGRTLRARIWRVDVGRIPLYLMDTDFDENAEKDRAITHHLYGGDNEQRLRQELLLGVGGIRLLNILNIRPDVYHINEGHAAFIGIERLRGLTQDHKLAFDEALEIVRASTLFTTHTPVPAGHDTFSEDLLRTYIPHYADRLNIGWDHFMGLGRAGKENSGPFSMSILALKMAQEVNGVSRIHGNVTRQMFSPLYPGYYPGELHIGHVTNGIHYPTWTARQFKRMYDNELGRRFFNDQSNHSLWRKIHQVPSEALWKLRFEMKKKLIDFLKRRIGHEMTQRQDPPNLVLKAVEALDPDKLTFGFARRFATYKRAHLLFNNLDRLAGLLGDPARPVQIIYSGKAHPNDKAGQDLIKRIIEISKMPAFIGKVFFLENYDMNVARMLVQGVDVWLNTPTRPQEASGTSGEKAIMNGVLNFSVLDGWWAEGYRPGAGWAVSEGRTYDNQQFQNELDAETIYNILENNIIPLYYDRSNKDIPVEWLAMVKNCISDVNHMFTMKRMLDEYYEKYYRKLVGRSREMKKDAYALAARMATWKKHILSAWDGIGVVSMKLPDPAGYPLKLGDAFKAEIKLNTNGIEAGNIGVELIFGHHMSSGSTDPLGIVALELVNAYKETATYAISVPVEYTGKMDFSFRIFPVHPSLPHRQDFGLVKWL
ncbi:MAG: alpha-glucan family phosphorylase [Bacteroidales bacterium]